MLGELVLLQTLTTKVDDDRRLKHNPYRKFSKSLCVCACQDLYKSGIWLYNAVFFFPHAVNHAEGVGQHSAGSQMRQFCVKKRISNKGKKKKVWCQLCLYFTIFLDSLDSVNR